MSDLHIMIAIRTCRYKIFVCKENTNLSRKALYLQIQGLLFSVIKSSTVLFSSWFLFSSYRSIWFSSSNHSFKHWISSLKRLL